MNKKQAALLARALLDDGYGVCEDGYNQLLVAIEQSGHAELAVEISKRTDAANGRFYVGEGVLDDLIGD